MHFLYQINCGIKRLIITLIINVCIQCFSNLIKSHLLIEQSQFVIFLTLLNNIQLYELHISGCICFHLFILAVTCVTKKPILWLKLISIF